MDNRKRNGDKRNIEASNKVKRCLFGKPDDKEREAESERLKEETQRQLEVMKLKYNFDFINEKPLQLPNARYIEWEKVESFANNQSDHSDGRPDGTCNSSTTTQRHAEIERQLNISSDGTGANLGQTSSDDESNDADGARKQDNSTEEVARLS